jgi:hypothetical protein
MTGYAGSIGSILLLVSKVSLRYNLPDLFYYNDRNYRL